MLQFVVVVIQQGILAWVVLKCDWFRAILLASLNIRKWAVHCCPFFLRWRFSLTFFIRGGKALSQAVETTVVGMGYELVDEERVGGGLLRVTIDRLDGHAITVDDCEAVTRQLQYALEVAGTDYARLEVSSPGLDRPLRTPAHFARFVGSQVLLTLKLPFEGRKKWSGLLRAANDAGCELLVTDGKAEQVLAATYDEVREARLVPVLDFKRGARKSNPQTQQPAEPIDGGQEQ